MGTIHAARGDTYQTSVDTNEQLHSMLAPPLF